MGTFILSSPQDFVATEYRPDGLYSVTIQADSWVNAERVCAERGLVLEGKMFATAAGITEEEAYAILGALEEREWVLLQ